MFLPVNHSKFATPMPRDCSFRESDWRALAGFWHPVAFAHEIADRSAPPFRRGSLARHEPVPPAATRRPSSPARRRPPAIAAAPFTA